MDEAPIDQSFLGTRLMSLLSIVATASTEEELLPEMDRYIQNLTLPKRVPIAASHCHDVMHYPVHSSAFHALRIMPVLNFLRYLLIRDRKEINQVCAKLLELCIHNYNLIFFFFLDWSMVRDCEK